MSDVNLVVNVPGPDAPGFLRRMRRALAFSAAFKNGNASPEAVDDMVEFLLDYVEQPEDRDAARDALWMASQAEFEALLEAVAGGGNSAVPPASGGS